MKTPSSDDRSCSGQVMAEACIGLALMAFAWIMVTYSLFMANNRIRTEMAARYAAWYQGANGQGTLATAAQMDQYFFYQPGLSTVTAGQVVPATGIGQIPLVSSVLLSDGTAANGPFNVKVGFGVTDASTATAYPFVLLNTHVPFMPSSLLETCLAVSSTSQWDGVADTWTNTPGKVAALLVVGGVTGEIGTLFGI